MIGIKNIYKSFPISTKKMSFINNVVLFNNLYYLSNQLHYIHKKSAKIVLEMIKNGFNNIVHEQKISLKEQWVFVSRMDIGRGPKLKRVSFRGKGKRDIMVSHRSNIRVQLVYLDENSIHEWKDFLKNNNILSKKLQYNMRKIIKEMNDYKN